MTVTAELLSWARDCAASAGCTAESAEYLERVSAWRDAWRPPEVRVLLVAESHVAEQPSDTNVRVRVFVPEAKPLPSGYCRLVYCLGYGESRICSPQPVSNRGTPQYWSLLGQLAWGPECRLPSRASGTVAERLLWKLKTLEALRDRGVWLVDAAVIAFYAPGGGRPFTGRRYAEVLRESFKRFVWPSVAKEPIELICVIGHGVAGSLREMSQLSQAMVISQPQDRNAARYRGGIARLRTVLKQLR